MADPTVELDVSALLARVDKLEKQQESCARVDALQKLETALEKLAAAVSEIAARVPSVKVKL